MTGRRDRFDGTGSRPWSKVRRALAIGLTALVLAACGGAGSRTTTTQPPPAQSVPWNDYAPTLKPRIDGLAASRDCPALQREFDTADANNAATRARTGHNNADLMGYIDDAMRAAGCY